MREVDSNGWEAVGRISNTEYFLLEDRILAAVPDPGCEDTQEPALENQKFQPAWSVERGVPGAVIVFFDRMVSQDAGARRIDMSREARGP